MRLALVVLAGCGRVGFAPAPDAGDGGGEHSGTRLEVVWNVFADGARQPAGVFDALRGEACAIEALADGHIYCLPAPSVSAAYADASCAQPLAVWDGQCTQPRYAIDRTMCGATRGVYPFAAASGLVTAYERTPGSCAGPVGEPGTIYDVGPALSPTDLAEVSLVSTGTDRMAAESYVSADGFAIQGPAYDRELAASCTPLVTASGVVCLPDDISYTDATLDASCTQPLAVFPAACRPPAFASYTPLGQCGQAYATLGAPLVPQPTTLYAETAGSCAVTSLLAGFDYYALGAEIALPPLARAPVPDAAHRIWAVDVTAAGFRYRDAKLYDSALGVECAVGTAADGNQYCIPSGGDISHLFGDPGCTMPLDVAIDVAQPSCAAPMPAFALRFESTACGVTERVFRVGAPFAGALYGGSPASCSTQTALGPVFSVTEIQPSELAPATRAMAP